MPLPVPTLDDRTFDQLVAEGRSLIPRYTREWTNHNLSDPGITLLELFAYLTETAIFQLDQVPEQSVELFLRLVGGCRLPGETIAAATTRELGVLERPPRAVTAAEVVRTALELSEGRPVPLRRAELVSRRDPACGGDLEHVLVGVFERPLEDGFATEDRLFRLLKEYAPLATRLHVVEARYARVGVRVVVVRVPGSGLDELRVRQTIARFLDPLTGGEEGTGWPFGRPVYRSELFQLLEQLPAVDHVERLELAALSPEATLTSEGVHIPELWLVDRAVEFDVTVVEG
jgi:hypothetical protein